MNESQELHSNAFQTFLQNHLNGRLSDEISHEMHDCLQAVGDFEGQAEMTIKLKFKPLKGGQIYIESDVQSKKPKAGIAPGIMFVDEDGCLHRNDPRQKEFDLRTVETSKEAPKQAEKKGVREA